jgi:hypothetical protein
VSAPALRPTFGEIEARLAAEGLAPEAADAAPQPVADDVLLPWFTRVLVGVGAWMSALFGLAIFGLAFGSDFESAAIVVGPVLIVGSVLVLRAAISPSGGAVFMRQCALAGLLAGQVAFVIGVAKVTSGELPPALASLAVAVSVAVVVTEPVGRFLSTASAAAAFAFALAAAGVARAFDVVALVLAAATSALWLTRPARLERRGEDLLAPAAYALALALLTTLLFATSVGPFDEFRWHHVRPPGHPAMIGLGLGAVALVIAIRRELRLGAPSPVAAAAIAGLALLGPVTPGSPGLVGAVLVVLLALHRRAPVLLGMALVFLFFFLGAFYYALTATLLVKAAYLGLAGAALLAGALVLGRRARP